MSIDDIPQVQVDTLMVTKTNYRYIVRSPDTAGGKPRIAGRRITVQNVVIWHEQMGFSVDEIASQYDLAARRDLRGARVLLRPQGRGRSVDC